VSIEKHHSKEDSLPRLSAAILFCLAFFFASNAFAIQPNQVIIPQRVKALNTKLEQFGTGEHALIAVRMKDKSAVSGYVAELGGDWVRVVDPKTGEETKISLYKVDRLQGYNLETGKEVHENTGLKGKLACLALKGWPGHQVPANGFTHSTALIVGIIIGILLAIILSKAL
jgi:hypothetical protein